MTKETRRTVEYWAERGIPEAQFVVAVKKARANGTPQYGDRFTAWLKANGVKNTEAVIHKLS